MREGAAAWEPPYRWWDESFVELARPVVELERGRVGIRRPARLTPAFERLGDGQSVVVDLEDRGQLGVPVGAVFALQSHRGSPNGCTYDESRWLRATPPARDSELRVGRARFFASAPSHDLNGAAFREDLLQRGRHRGIATRVGMDHVGLERVVEG